MLHFPISKRRSRFGQGAIHFIIPDEGVVLFVTTVLGRLNEAFV
jgi:hypothetical protein